MGRQRKNQNRRRPRQHAGGPGGPVFGVESSASGPREVHTATASLSLIPGPAAPPQRQKQTARYSGPPRGGAHVNSRLAGRSGTALDAEDDSDSDPARVAIRNFTPYLDTITVASAVCSFVFTASWNPSHLMRSGVELIRLGPWFGAREYVSRPPSLNGYVK